jgi:hypothetical protein
MIDDQDFTLDAGPDAGPGPESGGAEAGPPAPRVVIEYRSRGLSSRLWPPLLILVAALVIVTHQRQRPIRPVPMPVEPEAPKPPPEPLVVKVITEPARPRPVAGPPVPGDRGVPNPPMPDDNPGSDGPGSRASTPITSQAPPEADPGPEPKSEPVQVAAVDRPAIGFVPPDERGPAESSEPTEPQPVPSREEVMEDVQREADRIEAERQRLEEIKPQLEAWGLIEVIRKAQRQRAEFHDDLRQILMVRGDAAGKDILNLCDSYGRTTRPEVEHAVNRALRTSHARLSLRSKVEMMRFLGWPEPRILDYLVGEHDWTIRGRGGPRDANSARVLAARLLLTMPIKPASRPATASATPARPAGRTAPRPVAEVAPHPVRGGNRLPQ